MLVDIGVNLMHRRFDADREAVVARARSVGVDSLIITGTSLATSRSGADYAAGRAGLYSTAGLHPHDAQNTPPDTLAQLRRLAALPQVVAIGETGLDFHRDFSPRPLQEHWFRAQVALACELKLPLFLHEREAHDALMAILTSFGRELPPVVVHCFTGSGNALDTYLAAGYHIGITGWICDERRGLNLQELVQRIPPERLMLETDAPFLTPRTLRPRPAGGRNEPAWLPHVLETVASCRGQTIESVATATTATAQRFFGLSSP